MVIRKLLSKLLSFLGRATSPINTDMDVSKNGIDLVKGFEDLRLESYLDDDNVWTIGWGHTGPEVGPGQKITIEEAERLIREDLKEAIDDVNKFVKVALNQNQFDALVSFTFNIGGDGLRKSTALRLINSGDFTLVPDAMGLWVKDHPGGKVLPGLVKRRKKESDLFMGR